MATIPLPRMSATEFLDFASGTDGSYEFHDGEVFRMEAITQAHFDIALNVVNKLRYQLAAGPCLVYGGAIPVEVRSGKSYLEPDVVVFCNSADRNASKVTTPLVIFEVLSESTEKYDRGRKFEYYRTSNSLREYLLVAQDRVSVEHYTASGGGAWTYRVYNATDESILLESIGTTLAVAAIYAGVSFEAN